MRTPNFSGTVNDIEKKIERKENSGNKLSKNFPLGTETKNKKFTKNELIEMIKSKEIHEEVENLNLKPRNHANAYHKLNDCKINVGDIQKIEKDKEVNVENVNEPIHMIRVASQNEINQIKFQDIEYKIIDNKIDETLKQRHVDVGNTFLYAGENQNLILQSKQNENEISLKSVVLLQNKDEKEYEQTNNETKILRSDLIQDNVENTEKISEPTTNEIEISLESHILIKENFENPEKVFKQTNNENKLMKQKDFQSIQCEPINELLQDYRHIQIQDKILPQSQDENTENNIAKSDYDNEISSSKIDTNVENSHIDIEVFNILKRNNEIEYLEEEHNHMILIRNPNIDNLENCLLEEDINSNFPHPLSSPNSSQNDKNIFKYDNGISAHPQDNLILFENNLNSPCMHLIAEEEENEDAESYTTKNSGGDYQNKIYIQDNFNFADNPPPAIDFENFHRHNYPKIPIGNAHQDRDSNDLNSKLSKNCTKSATKQRESGFHEEILKNPSLTRRDNRLLKTMKESVEVVFIHDKIGVHKGSEPQFIGECSSIEFDNLVISEKVSIMDSSNNCLLHSEQRMMDSSPSPKIIENQLIEVESCNFRDICKGILIFACLKKTI